MAIPTILKGDATNANGRTVAIHLPDENLDGFTLRFEYLGITREFDRLTGGGTVHADFSESETAMFPLGTHFGTIRLGRAGKWHTVSATVPVKVSDNVGEVYGGDAANINLSIDFCGGIPDLSGIETEPTTANALARAFKALVDALKGAAGTVALIACMAAFGAPRMTVHSAPLGEVAFGNRVVTGVEFDESGLVTEHELNITSNALANAIVVAGGFTPEMATNVARSVVKPHIDNRDNPHNVTAAQVGALSLEGGTITGDLAIGEKERPASRKLTVGADGGANGIQLTGGNVSSGSTITIGGSSGPGGTLVVEDGGSGNASIRKGDKEVATEDYVDAKIGNAVVKDAENVVTGSFSIKRTFGNQESSLSFGDNDPSGPSIVMSRLFSTAPSSFFSGSIALIPSSGEKTSMLSRIKEYSTARWDARQEVESIVSSAIRPTDPTFSNAVLSVGLNIDTNSVAVLNEIADSFGGFPIEGTATTIGGLLAALAAAVTWLKKNKADKATTLDGYGITDAATEEQLTPISAQSAYPMSTVADGALKDRTVNHATAGGTFTFPERTGTNARDFVLVIDALSEAPTVIFPGSFTYVSEQDAADIWTAEADKVNAWYFSEVADGVFMACHKAMGVVAQ